MGAESMGKKRRDEELDRQIRAAYNTDYPEFAFVCGGMRRIAIDSHDRRARRNLLRRGFRYFARNPFFIYSCLKILPVDVFLDIGVNYGECLFAVPPYWPTKVRGYEANPALHGYIRRSLSLNADLSNLKVYQVAMFDEPGRQIDFFVDTQWSGKSSALLDPTQKGVQRIIVPTTTVDREMQKLGAVRCALIKIDVEGLEPAVLRGAQRTNENVENIIYLIEFDGDYLSRAGEPATDFFNSLAREFQVFNLQKDGLTRVTRYAELEEIDAGKPRIHVDLVLTKFGSPSLASRFVEKFATPGVKKLRRELWQIK